MADPAPLVGTLVLEAVDEGTRRLRVAVEEGYLAGRSATLAVARASGQLLRFEFADDALRAEINAGRHLLLRGGCALVCGTCCGAVQLNGLSYCRLHLDAARRFGHVLPHLPGAGE
jgi:hypothetical protein